MLRTYCVARVLRLWIWKDLAIVFSECIKGESFGDSNS
jgi:hypothetical protein